MKPLVNLDSEQLSTFMMRGPLFLDNESPDVLIEYIPPEFNDINLGVGVNFSDRIIPKRASQHPFKRLRDPDATTIGITMSERSSVYSEDITVKMKALTINANFRASFGVGDFQGSYDKSSQEQSKSENILFRYYFRKIGDTIEDIVWNESNKPNIPNSITDETQKREAFFNKYGTHYISNIIYGFNIEVLGSYIFEESSHRTDFKAAFKAWNTSGGVNTTQLQTFSNESIRILMNIKCDKCFFLDDQGTEVELNPAYTNLDQVKDFLTKLSSGKIKITAAPIAFILTSFKYTLLDYQEYFTLFDSLSAEASPPSTHMVAIDGEAFEDYSSGFKISFADLNNDSGGEYLTFYLSSKEPLKINEPHMKIYLSRLNTEEYTSTSRGRNFKLKLLGLATWHSGDQYNFMRIRIYETP